MRKNHLFSALVIGAFAMATNANAQSQLEHPKKMFRATNNRLNMHVDLPVYLFMSTDSTGKDTQRLFSETNAKFSNPMYFDGHGIHYIRHRDYIHPVNHQEVTFEVFVDALAPTTTLKLTDVPKAVVGTTTFYGKGLSGSLSAKDQMSGVNGIYQSVNGAGYAAYGSDVAFGEEKPYSFKFYSADSVGNFEKENVREFTVDINSPTSKHTLEGVRQEDILSPKANILLSSEDATSGVKTTFYGIDGTTDKPYSASLKMATLNDGDHTLTYKAVDKVENMEEEKSYKFYVDKTPPVVTTEISGDRFNSRGKNYISSRSKLALSATDNKAGVEKIMYSINAGTYEVYDRAITLKPVQGTYKLLFYGIDKVENAGNAKTDDNLGNLYLDLTPPKLTFAYVGKQFVDRDTTFITKDTKIKLTAIDDESGTQKIEYGIDGGAESVYNDPFSIAASGLHTVKYSGTDNVNNKNEASFFMVVDNEGPEIYFHMSMDPIGKKEAYGKELLIFSPHTLLYLAATDEKVGTDLIYYSLDGTAEKLYASPLKSSVKGTHTLKVRAVDKLGNEKSTDVIEFAIE